MSHARWLLAPAAAVALYAAWSGGYRQGVGEGRGVADRHRAELAAAQARGRDAERSRRRDAIRRVYAADAGAFRAAGVADPQPLPDRLAALDRYLDDLAAIDVAGCPAEFRVAYRAHARTWFAYRDSVSRLTAAGGAGAFAATDPEAGAAGGSGRWAAAELDATYGTVRDTWGEVCQIGSGYGAAPPA